MGVLLVRRVQQDYPEGRQKSMGSCCSACGGIKHVRVRTCTHMEGCVCASVRGHAPACTCVLMLLLLLLLHSGARLREGQRDPYTDSYACRVVQPPLHIHTHMPCGHALPLAAPHTHRGHPAARP